MNEGFRLTPNVLRGKAALSLGMRAPSASKSTSSCTRKDSVKGFRLFNAPIAARRNRSESTVWLSSGRLFKYCTKTRAAT